MKNNIDYFNFPLVYHHVYTLIYSVFISFFRVNISVISGLV